MGAEVPAQGLEPRGGRDQAASDLLRSIDSRGGDQEETQKALAAGLSALTKSVEELKREVASIRFDDTTAKTDVVEDSWTQEPPVVASSAGVDQAAALEAEFLAEEGESEWGRYVAGAIETIFRNRIDESPVFSNYKGKLDTTCRQSLCRVRWEATELATMDATKREEALQRARWDMMAVIGQSGASGEIAVTTGEREGVPEMTVLIKQDGGGVDPDQRMKR